MPPFIDPRSLTFWNTEAALLGDTMTQVGIRALFAGAESGTSLLPAGVQQLINWDLFSQNAIDFLKLYRLTTVQGISDTSRNKAVDIIDEWLRTRAGMPPLERRLLDAQLKNDLGAIYPDHRVKQIAVTEVTRIYAEGNQLAWNATGVVGEKRWQTARDEMVCPICRPLHNTVAVLNGSFYLDPDELGGRQLGEGITVYAPPAHPNCRCWLKPVVDLRLVEQSFNDILGLSVSKLEVKRIMEEGLQYA